MLALLAAVGPPSCVDHGHPRVAFASMGSLGEVVRPTLTNDGRVILVTLDGVRAEDVFDGASRSLRPGVNVEGLTRPEAVMPRLHGLVATHGVALGRERPGCGSVRTASGANVSLPGYLEIFTGRKTRCRDNGCAPTEHTTVLDEAADAGLAVASIGSWNVLDHAVSRGTSAVFVEVGTHRWPGTRPLADARFERLVAAGERSDPHPGVGWYRPDALTMPIALQYLKDTQPAVMHIGLGDADEWGHRDDYAAYLQAIGRSDFFIGQLADTLDDMGEVGARTTVIVTTDHGRNADFRHHGPDSDAAGRTFVMAFGARVPVQGVACPARDVTLADIAPTIRGLVGLPADPSGEAGRLITEIAPP
ncbi:MAG TPA: alkaline phosphatase family protein [Labilithrix sp.]|nr:alkaline phosphatase family protein [Labilithrix sp.]